MKAWTEIFENCFHFQIPWFTHQYIWYRPFKLSQAQLPRKMPTRLSISLNPESTFVDTLDTNTAAHSQSVYSGKRGTRDQTSLLKPYLWTGSWVKHFRSRTYISHPKQRNARGRGLWIWCRVCRQQAGFVKWVDEDSWFPHQPTVHCWLDWKFLSKATPSMFTLGGNVSTRQQVSGGGPLCVCWRGKCTYVYMVMKDRG